MEQTITRPRPGGPAFRPSSPAPAPSPPAVVEQRAAVAPVINDYPHQQLVPAAPVEPPKVGNLAKALAAVMREIGTIEKGGYNAFHNYKYVRMEDLLTKVTPLLGKYGIVIFQNEIDVKMVEGNRIAVVYHFYVAHESGEIWGPMRFTGMAMARDRKGNFDHKAVNKCHTAARKYTLLSLVQAPAGDDIDDADAGEGNRQPARQESSYTQEDRRVPGPGALKPEQQAPRPQTAPATGPRKIALGANAGVAEWKNAYLAAVVTSKTRDEVLLWDTLNDMALQRIHQEYPEVSQQIMDAVEKHIDNIEGAPLKPVAAPTPAPAPAVDTSWGMPDPRERPGEAMAWIVEKLGEFIHYEAAKNFWYQVVAAKENDFSEGDWGNLIQEWRRTEVRLGPM